MFTQRTLGTLLISCESRNPPVEWKWDSDPIENHEPLGLFAVLKTDLWLIPDPLDLTDRCESKLEELTDENPVKSINMNGLVSLSQNTGICLT